MSDDRQLERTARAWLELGPTDAPDHAVEAALLTIESTSQERDLRIPWRLPKMTPITRLAGAAAVGILAVGITLFALRPASNVGVTPPTTAPAPSSPSPSPVPSGRPPIAEGTYATGPIKVADIVALINADASLTPAQRTHLIDVSFGIKDHTTFSVSIDLRNGQYTQHQSVDGVDAVGSGGTYSFLDANTLIFRESSSGLAGFQITQIANGFSLKRLDAAANAEDVIATKILLESGPFIRVP
jgi:hypothetical protein